MADELPTDAPNSIPTQTDAPAQTDNPSSITPGTDAAADAGVQADPLEGASLLDKPADAAAGDDAGEGDKGGDDDQGDDQDGDKDAGPSLIGAPEGDYDLSGLMPEGVSVDATALEAIAPIAKAANLSNEGLAKLALEGQGIFAKQFAERQINDVVAVRTGWHNDTMAAINGGKNTDGDDVARDPAFQGKSFDQVSSIAAKAIDRFSGDKLFPAAKIGENGELLPGTFRDYLKTTGLGNHPAMMHFAFVAGSAISEDTDLPSGQGISTAKSREEKYYGSK